MRFLCPTRKRFTGWVLFLSLTGAVAVQATQQAASSLEVPASVAAGQIVKKVDPEYPKLPRMARIEGVVVLKATISPEGRVTNVIVVSGQPLLIPAALDAVKQWQYQPFMVDGQAATAKTTIQIVFSLGIPSAEYTKEQEAYFQQEDKCRALVSSRQYGEAEPACKMGAELAEKLPESRTMERITAYRQAGRTLFYQRKFDDALSFYQQALAVAKTHLKLYEAELAYAYHDVALGLHATGDLSQARSYYDKSEATLEQARGRIDSEFLRDQYSAAIKSVLTDYAILLRQVGDESGAEAAERKANSIVVKTDLNDK